MQPLLVLGGGPTVEEFADPPGNDVADVVAAPLNPFDLIVAAGQMPARQVSPPFIAGIEGIARLADGTCLLRRPKAALRLPRRARAAGGGRHRHGAAGLDPRSRQRWGYPVSPPGSR